MIFISFGTRFWPTLVLQSYICEVFLQVLKGEGVFKAGEP